MGGQPLVQPNGTVVVPFNNGGMFSFVSTDGGGSWSTTYTIVGSVPYHGTAGGFRTYLLPSAELDASGKIYASWMDCRFRSGCTSNDIVMSTSTDGKTWTSPARIPIDPVTSTVDHFIPGLGVDPATTGSTAHLALTYYYFPVANCGGSCQLYVGYVVSKDGGMTWTAGKPVAGPMMMSWLPDSDLGKMVADYISTSYVNGNAYSVFAVATNKAAALYSESMYTTPRPLGGGSEDEPVFSSQYDQPIPGVQSDHPPQLFYDDEGRYPIPPEKQGHPGDD